MKTAKKVEKEEKGYGRLHVSRKTQKQVGMIAGATRETQPEVVERVAGPAFAAEIARIAKDNGKGK